MTDPAAPTPLRPDRAAPDGLALRAATRADLEAVVALFVDDETGGHGDTLDPSVWPVYEAAWARVEASPNDTIYVAELDGPIVGTYQLTFVPTIVHRGRLRAMIESVHVLSRLRGHGIGQAMMIHAVETARAAGAGIVQLTSNKRRLDAHRFYERLGFEKSHEGFKLEVGSRRV